MFALGRTWDAAGQQLTAVVPQLQAAATATASVVAGETGDSAVASLQLLFSGDYSLDNVAAAMSALGELASNTGTQIQYTKLQIVTTLGIAAAEIVYALAAAYWTFDASLSWIPAIEAITVAGVRTMLSQLLRRVLEQVEEALTMTGVKALVKSGAKMAAVNTGIAFAQEMSIEGWQKNHGDRDGWDVTQILKTVAGGALGG